MRFLSIEPLLEDLGTIDLKGIDWVIVGGESGAGARPMQKDWVVNLRRQCQAAGVPFFFKQWGGVRKSQAGRVLDGRTYDDMPSRSRIPSLSQRERFALIREAEAWNAALPPQVALQIA
jgi:protein gp37